MPGGRRLLHDRVGTVSGLEGVVEAGDASHSVETLPPRDHLSKHEGSLVKTHYKGRETEASVGCTEAPVGKRAAHLGGVTHACMRIAALGFSAGAASRQHENARVRGAGGWRGDQHDVVVASRREPDLNIECRFSRDSTSQAPAKRCVLR